MVIINSLKIFVAMFRYMFFVLNPTKGITFTLLLFLFAMSIASYFFDPNTIVFFNYIAVISILISFVQILQELFNYDDLHLIYNKDLTNNFHNILPSKEEQIDGFATIFNSNIENSTVLFSTKFNKFIIQNENDFKLVINESNRKAFYLSIRNQQKPLSTIIQWKCFYSIKQEHRFVNESKVSLCSPIRTNVKELKIFKVDYFSSYLTNEISATKIIHKSNGRGYIGFDPSITFPQNSYFGERRMKEFGEYLFGNHIGTSTIAISSDKYLCFWRQNSKAQQSPNLLVPTGSGSVDWADLEGNDSFKALITKAINRELYEESLQRGADLKFENIEGTLLIGYFRRFIRGGKSEFLAISKLSIPHMSLVPNEDEVEDTTGSGDQMYYAVKTFADLKRIVQFLIDDIVNKQNTSTSLWVNLLALNDAIKYNSPLVKKFLGYI